MSDINEHKSASDSKGAFVDPADPLPPSSSLATYVRPTFVAQPLRSFVPSRSASGTATPLSAADVQLGSDMDQAFVDMRLHAKSESIKRDPSLPTTKPSVELLESVAAEIAEQKRVAMEQEIEECRELEELKAQFASAVAKKRGEEIAALRASLSLITASVPSVPSTPTVAPRSAAIPSSALVSPLLSSSLTLPPVFLSPSRLSAPVAFVPSDRERPYAPSPFNGENSKWSQWHGLALVFFRANGILDIMTKPIPGLPEKLSPGLPALYPASFSPPPSVAIDPVLLHRSIRCYEWLINSVASNEELYTLISTVPSDNAHVAWRLLVNRFEERTLSTSRAAQVEFMNAAQRVGEKVADYFFRFQVLHLRATDRGVDVYSEEWKINAWLHGLLPAYDAIRKFGSVYSRVNPAPLSMEVLLSFSQEHESSMSVAAPASVQALAVSSSPSGNRGDRGPIPIGTIRGCARCGTTHPYEGRGVCSRKPQICGWCQMDGHAEQWCHSRLGLNGKTKTERVPPRVKVAEANSVVLVGSPPTPITAHGSSEYAFTIRMIDAEQELSAALSPTSLSISSPSLSSPPTPPFELLTVNMVVDSGSTVHALAAPTQLESASINNTIKLRVANGAVIAAPLIGRVGISSPLGTTFALDNVVQHANMPYNILSTRVLAQEHGFSTTFQGDAVLIKDESGRVVLRGGVAPGTNLYTVDVHVVPAPSAALPPRAVSAEEFCFTLGFDNPYAVARSSASSSSSSSSSSVQLLSSSIAVASPSSSSGLIMAMVKTGIIAGCKFPTSQRREWTEYQIDSACADPSNAESGAGEIHSDDVLKDIEDNETDIAAPRTDESNAVWELRQSILLEDRDRLHERKISVFACRSYMNLPAVYPPEQGGAGAIPGSNGRIKSAPRVCTARIKNPLLGTFVGQCSHDDVQYGEYCTDHLASIKGYEMRPLQGGQMAIYAARDIPGPTYLIADDDSTPIIHESLIDHINGDVFNTSLLKEREFVHNSVVDFGQQEDHLSPGAHAYTIADLRLNQHTFSAGMRTPHLVYVSAAADECSPAKFIGHSDFPNCYLKASTDEENCPLVQVLALRAIEKGELLCADRSDKEMMDQIKANLAEYDPVRMSERTQYQENPSAAHQAHQASIPDMTEKECEAWYPPSTLTNPVGSVLEEEAKRKQRILRNSIAFVSDPTEKIPASRGRGGPVIMPLTRCTHPSNSGGFGLAQCTDVADHGCLCPVHTHSMLGLEVKQSLLPAAGLGLFATIPLKAGYGIAYTGEMHFADGPVQVLNYSGSYVTQVDKSCIPVERVPGGRKVPSMRLIDACRTDTSIARYANDGSVNDVKNNARLVSYERGAQVMIELTRPVARGEEILCTYGPDFWKRRLDDPMHLKTIAFEHPPTPTAPRSRKSRAPKRNVAAAAAASSSSAVAASSSSSSGDESGRSTPEPTPTHLARFLSTPPTLKSPSTSPHRPTSSTFGHIARHTKPASPAIGIRSVQTLAAPIFSTPNTRRQSFLATSSMSQIRTGDLRSNPIGLSSGGESDTSMRVRGFHQIVRQERMDRGEIVSSEDEEDGSSGGDEQQKKRQKTTK